MNDKKFLAQLNLYLDGEIDAADAAALEQEILADPARRRIYNDYCRIHRATKLVYEQFRAAGAEQSGDFALPANRVTAETPISSAAFTPGGRTGGRAAQRPFRRFAFAGGLAAACAVGVFIGASALAPRAPQPAAPAPAIAVSDTAPAAPVVATTIVAPIAPERSVAIAPFAAQLRADPYLVQLPQAPSDPFALAPWIADETATGLSAASMSLTVDPRLRPAAQELNDEQNQRRRNPFRVRVERSADASALELTTEPQ